MARNDKKVRIFSALEVANICGVVNQTAINWIKNGYLKAFMTPGGQYRVYAEDLQNFLNSRGMRIPEELNAILADEPNWKALLIVDDDRELNQLMKTYLTRKLAGFEIHQAYNGFEAGRLLAEQCPGFIILDINLPGIDGHALCKRIKEDPSLGNPFILSISGLDLPYEKERILQEGADLFFAKPLELESFSDTLKGFIDEHWRELYGDQ